MPSQHGSWPGEHWRAEGPTHLGATHTQGSQVPLLSPGSGDPVAARLALWESTQRDGGLLLPRRGVAAAPRHSSSPARRALLMLQLLPGEGKGISQGW